MERRRFLAGLGGAGLTGLAGCTALGTGDGGDDYDVGMTATQFRPAELTVGAGEEVVWENTSSRAHSVTAYGRQIPAEAEYFASGGFDSEGAAREAWRGLKGALQSGDSYARTFGVPGRYDYFCIPHEQGGMVGRIVVEG